MQRIRLSTKIIVANSLLALLVLVAFASFSLNRFYAENLRQEQRNLDKCLAVFRELVARDGAPFSREGDLLLAGGRTLNGEKGAIEKMRSIYGAAAAIYLGDVPIAGNGPDGLGKPVAGARLEGAAYGAVCKEGRAYHGEELLNGHRYLIAYRPIRDGNGMLLGSLFVGVRAGSFLEDYTGIKTVTITMLAVLLVCLCALTSILLKLTRRFENAEANSLRLLGTLMDTIPCPIYYKDASGRYLGFNKAYEGYVGMPREKMLGKTVHDLWPEDLAATYEQHDRALRENPGVQIYEGPFVFADGSRHDVIFHKGTFLSERGAVAGSVGVIFDITERKAAEEETKNSRQRLHDIIDFLPDATFVIDSDGRVIAWNKAIEEMTGVSKEEMIGRGDHAYAIPFYGKPRPILIDLLDSDPERLHPEYPLLKREGRTLFAQSRIPAQGKREAYYIWGTAAPLFDSRGNRVGAIESMRDITEYNRVDSQLRLKNLLQATQLECSIDGILAVDEQGRVLSYNRRFLEIFNLPQAMIDGAEADRLLKLARECAEQPEGYLEKVREIYRKRGETSRDELLLKGGVVIDRYSAPMMDADGHYYGRVWYFRDITEQRHAEEVRSRLEVQRHHNRLMESFITRLGHDLRTPLTPLFILIPLLKDKVKDPDLSAMIDICSQSVLTVHELTEKALRLMALSAPTSGLLRKVQLSEEVSGFLADKGEELASNLVSCENGIDGGIVVEVVPDQLRELFGNLISNAARHSRAGGVVRIEARRAENQVTVAVRDEGDGAEPDELEQLFDEFYKADASRHDLGSPGLGLAICRKIVSNHRGTIWAESGGKGLGLTVRFTLPTG